MEGITVVIVFKGVDFFSILFLLHLKYSVFGFDVLCGSCAIPFPSLYENVWEKSEAHHEKSIQSN